MFWGYNLSLDRLCQRELSASARDCDTCSAAAEVLIGADTTHWSLGRLEQKTPQRAFVIQGGPEMLSAASGVVVARCIWLTTVSWFDNPVSGEETHDTISN